ncbi:transcription-repair coupling factor [Bacteriovoracaceae bacterium]|nr:transcription-repair coupling factor [Bacteriovoracaceae bacterium]
MFFESIYKKINDSISNNTNPCMIGGVDPSQIGLINHLWSESKGSDATDSNIISLKIFSTVEEAEYYFEKVKKLDSKIDYLFYPGLEVNPFSGFIASERNLYERFYCLSKLANGKSQNFEIITTIEGVLLKTPDMDFFRENSFLISVSDILSPYDLAAKLIDIGYTSATTVEEAGTFSSKGEIFDIFPISSDPIRIHYFDDMIEEIFSIDADTNRTIKDKPLEQLSIAPCPGIFCQDGFSLTLRENLPNPSLKFKDRVEKRKSFFQKLSQQELFENYPIYLPLFFKNATSFLEVLEKEFKDLNVYIFESNSVEQNLNELIDSVLESYDFYHSDVINSDPLPKPQQIYNLDTSILDLISKSTYCTNHVEIGADFNNSSKFTSLSLQPLLPLIDEKVEGKSNKEIILKNFTKLAQDSIRFGGKVLFVYSNDNSLNEFKHLLEVIDSKIENSISYVKYELSNGFYYKNENLVVLTDGDIFSSKKKKAKTHQKQDYDLFAEQLSTLKKGDFVIHSEHGLGVFQGLETMTFGGQESDFIILDYQSGDKVYVPVYKINLIQKHADSLAALKPDSLRTNKFANVKKRARESAKKLAFDLLELQAQRETSSAYAFSPPDDMYRDFELSFPFQETKDQMQAIHDVVDVMQKPKPMDYLVCGDVGFGKTEVAMRAAFKAVLDHKQVAVLVPTTILALQHYNSFVKRFRNFPVNINFISRFKTPKETSQILDKAEKGEIDILIGTHKLLSDKIKYNDLGLVIVDEEQRFGVGHKEKLKAMKSSVDFLTLTATPIPRTMQLAFLGLRDLSLIKTPPPKRQSIKSYIIKQDDLTLQTAIKKELSRGGQVFIVHNKVSDIEQFSSKVRKLVPNAKIVIGHGQLPERELEKRMKAFYQGEYQILIATTIIESGIDIPSANTMIIERADTFGLAQLHQLRGRIGRSDKKAYCYFVIPNDRNLSNVAEKRLKALQTYADMGSGFNIANCDLEIRGAGDILGANQSGHLESVGLELYTELLQDSIRNLKGEKNRVNRNIEISTPWPAFIPQTYIHDSKERLRHYKKLSNAETFESLDNQREDLIDIFGAIPVELDNLFHVLNCRIILSKTGISHIQINGSNISLKFNKDTLSENNDLQSNVVQLFMSRPKIYKFSPDFKVLCHNKEAVSPSYLLNFSKHIAEQIVPC